MSEKVKRYSLSEFAEQHTHPVGPGTYVEAADYDALRAEAESLWSTYSALVDKLWIDTEKAKTADGKPSDVIVGYAEALRAENERLSQQLAQSDSALRESRANDMTNVRTLEDMWERHDALRQELEAIKGQQPVAFYWQDIGYPEPRKHGPYFGWPDESAMRNVDGGAIPIPLYALPPAKAGRPGPSTTFKIGQRVRKKSGSEWQGMIVGTYSTALTPEGYAVESDAHAGSVQIYPASALEAVE